MRAASHQRTFSRHRIAQGTITRGIAAPGKAVRRCPTHDGSFRCGFTLVETLIALTLALLAIGVALGLLTRQQRAYREVGELLGVRERVRDAASILPVSLRATAVLGDTIRLATDTAIELYVPIGVSTLCAPPTQILASGLLAAGATLAFPPDTLDNGNSLTAWLTPPDSGDDVLVFHDSSARSPTRGWERLHVVNVATRPSGTVCSPATGLTTQSDAELGRRAYEIAVSPAPSPAVRTGAPVRFVRRGRYSAYLASDRDWYLGYRRCDDAGGCETIQPVSGPYRHHGSSPIIFRYYRRDGTEIVTPGATTEAARVDIVVHGDAGIPLPIVTSASTPFGDSAVISIAFRNPL